MEWVPQMCWFKCSEGLPSDEVDVLTFAPGWADSPVVLRRSRGAWRQAEWGPLDDSMVTHWMPLPPPPIGT